jgi:hypothetical protein
MDDRSLNEFEKMASTDGVATFLGEFWQFLRYNKKWWLLPILVVMLLFCLLMVAQGGALAPFIYTLF